MCSREQWKADEQPILVGRNMDWTARMGTMLYAMPKAIERRGLIETNPIRWTSKYGNAVAAVWDCAGPDGMKQAGLTARTLYRAETECGDRDTARPGLSVSLRAQFYRDNFTTTVNAQVIDSTEASTDTTFAVGVRLQIDY